METKRENKLNINKLFTKILCVCFLASIIVALCILFNVKDVFAKVDSNKEISSTVKYSVEQVSKEMLGEEKISKSEYLLNLDGASDYVYVEFKDGGYAIFLKESMELMERSQQGKLNFPTDKGDKYYGGPGTYLYKDNDSFVNCRTQEILDIDKDVAKSYAKQTRENLLRNYNSNVAQNNVEYDYSIVESDITEEPSNTGVEMSTRSVPGYDDNLIHISDSEFIIANYQYFLKAPKHGTNSTGTCGAVAAQLLLSYHNYYSDRRIIADRYLYGDSIVVEENPNYCTDPMSMTPYTLGTRGINEDGSDDENSYFHYLVENIPSNAYMSQVQNGINNILQARNNEISGTINYTLNRVNGNVLTGAPADYSNAITEIESERPILILLQQSLGAIDHYAVAYAYDLYRYPGTNSSYLGYIAHMGWESNYQESFDDIWVNNLWCVSYITLDIEHTHNYIEVGQIPNTDRIEHKCSTCGHRTDAVILMSVNDRYVERRFTSLQNDYEYKDFYIKFATGGVKMFQTFGNYCTFFNLYDSEYNYITFSEGGGYGANSMLCYNVQANTVYILRVKVMEVYAVNIKLGITPVDSSYSDYSQMYNIEGTSGTHNFVTSLNATYVMTFTPTETGTYSFNTNYTSTLLDAYLYVIDPEIASACLSDDDSGGSYQALITTELFQGVDYFIVISTYNIETTAGGLSLTITKET